MENRYLRTVIVAGLLGVIVVLLSISVVSANTDPIKTNNVAIERVSPSPGGLQNPQADIFVDLKDGYIGRLQIDGKNIPDDELAKVESLGQYIFHPKKSKVIEQLQPGTHKAIIFFWPSNEDEPQQPENYKWDFQVTS